MNPGRWYSVRDPRGRPCLAENAECEPNALAQAERMIQESEGNGSRTTEGST